MAKDVEPMGGDAVAFVAFAGATRIATGSLAKAAIEAKRALDEDDAVGVLVFNADSGHVVDLDLRGTEAEVFARYDSPRDLSPKRGRPRLGVVAREVTLLPRHWEWLASQAGGASVALRRLVEVARKLEIERGVGRARAEAAYRFMSAMAGDLPGFEDAARSLFAGDQDRLRLSMKDWPQDIQDQVLCYLVMWNHKTRHD